MKTFLGAVPIVVLSAVLTGCASSPKPFDVKLLYSGQYDESSKHSSPRVLFERRSLNSMGVGQRPDNYKEYIYKSIAAWYEKDILTIKAVRCLDTKEYTDGLRGINAYDLAMYDTQTNVLMRSFGYTIPASYTNKIKDLCENAYDNNQPTLTAPTFKGKEFQFHYLDDDKERARWNGKTNEIYSKAKQSFFPDIEKYQINELINKIAQSDNIEEKRRAIVSLADDIFFIKRYSSSLFINKYTTGKFIKENSILNNYIGLSEYGNIFNIVEATKYPIDNKKYDYLKRMLMLFRDENNKKIIEEGVARGIDK